MTGGESAYVHFGYESTFKGGSTCNKVFGQNVQIKNVDLKNNIKRIFNLGGRSAVAHVAGKIEGAISIEFDLNEPWFMQGVMGAISTSGSATSAYYHTFTEANRPPSLAIENGISGTVRTYLGCVIGDCKISTAVGDEPAKCTLTVMYADEAMTFGSTTQIKSSGGIFPFTYGSIQYPTGTTVANTESVELTIANNAALKWGLGSRKSSRYDMRQRTYDVSTTNYFDDPTQYLRLAYGSPTLSAPNSTMVSGESGITISLNNGETSASAKRIWSFIFTNAVIERHSLGVQNVETEQMETINIIPESLIVQVVNQATSMP
jgi:hypothetical protein